MNTEQMKLRPEYGEGVSAAREEKKISDCPYNRHDIKQSESWKVWMLGFTTTKRIIKNGNDA